MLSEWEQDLRRVIQKTDAPFLGYYAELSKIFTAANAPMSKELAATVQKIQELSA